MVTLETIPTPAIRVPPIDSGLNITNTSRIKCKPMRKSEEICQDFPGAE